MFKKRYVEFFLTEKFKKIFKLETFCFDHKNLDPDSVNQNLGSLATPVCYFTAWLKVMFLQ